MDIFTISGVPVGKGRPRFGNGHAYTPQKTADYEELVVWEYKRQCGKFYEGAVVLMIFAYYPIPKSATKKNIEKMLNGIIRPTVKPDCDNVVKVIADSLNGIAYKDDSQIAELRIDKYYSDTPCVKVLIGDVDSELNATLALFATAREQREVE